MKLLGDWRFETGKKEAADKPVNNAVNITSCICREVAWLVLDEIFKWMKYVSFSFL